MPKIKVNGASIFYRVFGRPRPSEPPILLIHGATVDGMTDWGALAPLLGLRHEVIVPDCRGHGRSVAPSDSYSFAELAEDVAALARALGHECVHLVGHSNGGNVALVTLVDHPNVIATCVLQAANAYVSPDLAEREARSLDPDRVALEEPEWRDQMIALHGPWHGERYWRTLLRLTLAETISAPAYGPAELGAVRRPALVIEGARDPVNAASGHGAFITRHIPNAESWRPSDAGHAVHQEMPLDWVSRVEDFWQRRGTTVADEVWRVGQAYRDPRTTVHNVRVSSGDPPTVVGRVLQRSQLDELGAAVGGCATIEVDVLADGARPAVVGAGVADVLRQPVELAERLTQAIIGEAVAVLDAEGAYVRARLEADGYVGWIRASQLEMPVDSRLSSDAAPRRCFVTADVTVASVAPGGAPAGRIPFGARLPVVDRSPGWVAVAVPSGDVWWIRADDVAAENDRPGLGATLNRFRRFVGVPYLWGGRTPFGFDCSGLSQAFYAMLGVAIPRDSDQQYEAGLSVVGQPHAGDLLFFREPGASVASPIAHVGIALDDETFLHAWGAVGAVAISSLDEGHAFEASTLRHDFAGARTFRLPTAT